MRPIASGMRLARAWCWIACCLLLFAGCSLQRLRGDGFKDDELGETGRELRGPVPQRGGAWGFSSKARDIERDLGVD